MKTALKKISFVLILLLLLGACSGILDDSTNHSVENETNINQDMTLDDLSDTEHFKKGALEHIFIGEINYHGDAVGFHYDGFPKQKGEIMPGTKTKADANGVYEAKVKVDDTKKTSNGGKSTFFPEDLTSQAVVHAINEAYENRTQISGNTYEGLSEAGMVIHMYLDESDQIISAFPIYDQ